MKNSKKPNQIRNKIILVIYLDDRESCVWLNPLLLQMGVGLRTGPPIVRYVASGFRGRGLCNGTCQTRTTTYRRALSVRFAAGCTDRGIVSSAISLSTTDQPPRRLTGETRTGIKWKIKKITLSVLRSSIKVFFFLVLIQWWNVRK